jgi:hypothetical protein
MQCIKVNKRAKFNFKKITMFACKSMNIATPFKSKQTSLLAICSIVKPPYSTEDLKINVVKLFAEPSLSTFSRFNNKNIF